MRVEVNGWVRHNLYGDGEVTKITEDRIYVAFGKKRRIFDYPDALDHGYLIAIDPADKQEEKVENKTISTAVQSTGVRKRILDVADDIRFTKIYEAINDAAGTEYTGWMKATWPNGNPDQSYRFWFTKLAKRKNGELIPVATDCINTISADLNEFIFDDLRGGYDENKPRYQGYSLIYTKDHDSKFYIFRGIFAPDFEKTTPNHYVHKRVGTRCKLIGQPANDIEILDD